MVPLSKDQHKWGFTCGRISVLEGKLLANDFFQSLVALERTEDVFHRLQDTPLRDSMVPGAVSWEDWGSIIDAYYRDLVISLWRGSPARAEANFLILTYDYLNLKRAIQHQGGAGGVTPPEYPFCMMLFPPDRLAAVASGNVSLLPDHLRPSAAMLTAGSGGGEENPFLVDMVLDGAYLRHLLALGADMDIPLITEWLKERVLAQAVVVLWRAARDGRPLKPYQQHFLPIGPFNGVLNELITTGDPRTWGNALPGMIGDLWAEAQQRPEDEQVIYFEQLVANYLTSLARRGKSQTAGPERVFGYMWGLYIEMFNLKLAISGRLNGIDADILKSRLRECYV